MKNQDADSIPSIAALVAKKQSNAERKFLYLRNLSDADRLALNERSAELCEKIAGEFNKKCRRLKIE